MNVVGLDIAYGDAKKHTGTGVAVAGGQFTIRAPKTSGSQRLVEMRYEVLKAVHSGARPEDPCEPCARCFTVPFGCHPDLVAIEGYSYASPNVAHQLGELGGVVRVELFEMGIPFVVVPPSSVKLYAAGKGTASKDDVLLAAVRRLGFEGNSKDQADAMWVRAVTLAALGAPIVDMPQAHLRALLPIQKLLDGAGVQPIAPLT